MAKSLVEIVLDFIGDRQKIFKLNSITALPYHLQEKFLPYLTAHDLLDITEKHSDHLSRKLLENTWNTHVQRRWSRSQIVMNIFHDAGLYRNPQLVYLQKYFLELLSYCSINLNTVDPISLFHCPLHKMNRPWPSDAIVKDPNDLTLHLKSLKAFSRYAETLTVIGSQCGWICGNEELINSLKTVTKILQIQAVNDTYYESISFLLQTLINHGKVTHAVFSMVNLKRDNLNELMQICAGIHFHKIEPHGRYDISCDKCANVPKTNHSPNKTLLTKLSEQIPSTSMSSCTETQTEQTKISFPNEEQVICPEADQYCLDLELDNQDSLNRNIANHQPTLSDEIDLYDEALNPIPSKDPVVVRGVYEPDGSYIKLKGLSTFALLNTNSHCKADFGIVLVDILPYWKSLRKFAIFDIDSESEELMNKIMKKLEDHQLTHLVIDDANLNHSFFERLLYVFKDHYRIKDSDTEQHKALELLDFQACLKSLTAEHIVPYGGNINGIYKLDLSMTTILDSGFDLLIEHVKCDTALRHLKLNGCFLREDQVLKLLSALSEINYLETLGLSGNRVREQEVETELIKFLNSNRNLKTLILNYSRLRCQFVDSEGFTTAIMSHPNLKELSIKNNHLKETVCRLLTTICCSKEPCSIKNLNIGYNWVKGADLVETAQNIASYRKCHHLSGPVLDFLCLSGNRLYLSDSSQSTLWKVFNGLVRDLEVDRIDPDRLFDEHLAQM